jgi:hypothetical protein
MANFEGPLVGQLSLCRGRSGWLSGRTERVPADSKRYAKKPSLAATECGTIQVCHERATGNNPHHVGSRNRFSCLPCLCCPSSHGLSPVLSRSGSRARVAVGSHRGHRHWHRHFYVPQGQQGRGYNLRPDQYPRRRLLGIRRRLFLHGWIEMSYAAAEQYSNK